MTEWQCNKLSQIQREKLDQINRESHGGLHERIESILQDNSELDDETDGIFTDKQLHQGKRMTIQETAGDINDYISQHLDDPLQKLSQKSQQQTISHTENSAQSIEIKNDEIDTSGLLSRIVTQAAEISDKQNSRNSWKQFEHKSLWQGMFPPALHTFFRTNRA
ncbi:MAG: hypothetical protein EZS28_023906 [Streblomastix strix]|uniref:Uncharacterized protein n=1 Tax=Streblomastix strix TaxID=222440 RepID=A0A5J4VDF1_9EUKA|nr:MAG: hypothetical protein EZS28_023906 [Streblomastix strix]